LAEMSVSIGIARECLKHRGPLRGNEHAAMDAPSPVTSQATNRNDL
jgi:hypothetical protein